MNQIQPHKSSIGNIAANLVAMLCFLAVLLFHTFGMVAVLVVFFVEKNSKYVKTQALQAILLYLLRTVLVVALDMFDKGFSGVFSLSFLPGGWLSGLFRQGSSLALGFARAGVGIAFAALCVWCALRAYKWSDQKLPVLGDWAGQLYQKSQNAALYDGTGPVPAGMEVNAPPPPPPQSEAPGGSASPHGSAPEAPGPGAQNEENKESL